ncbi:MAG: endonuclease/exonuclease/phosphatase family protein [Nitrospirota bacterium]
MTRLATKMGPAGWAVAALALAAIGLPLIGRLAWLAELSSHFVAQYAAAAAILALGLALKNRPWLAAVALAICLVQLARLAPLWTHPDPPTLAIAPERLTITQLNVNIRHQDPRRVVEWVIAEDPDIAVLIEVNRAWSASLTALRERYPHMLVGMPPDGSGIAVFAKGPKPSLRLEPLVDAWCPAIVLDFPEAPGPSPLALIATHLRSPMTPRDAVARNRQLRALVQRVAAEPALQKIVVGDLNITRWSPLFAQLTTIAGVRDGQEGFGLGGSWPSPFGRWLGIPIDQTLVSAGIRVVRRSVGPNLGSDHLPVTTTIEFSQGMGARADDRDFSG